MPTHFIGPGKWPYDDGSDLPYGPDSQQRQATRSNLIGGAGIGYQPDLSGRDGLVTSGDVFPGLHVYVAATDTVYKYNGAAWVTVLGPWVSGALTPATGVTIVSDSYARMNGTEVEIKGHFTRASGAFAASTNLATLPAGFAPPAIEGVMGELTSGGAAGAVSIVIGTDGTIATGGYITNTSSAAMLWRIHYFTA